ncbi:MAG: radical SAM protein [Clostridium sp.]|nr:radical SAM protein [Clostridium sp.]
MENNKIKPLEIYPFYVDFAITYNCNAQCQHCSINADFNEKYNRRDMSTEEIYKVIDELKEMGVLFVGLTGGEAITREDIYKIIDYCVACDMFVALATNGIAITDSVVKELKKHKLGNLFVSLDHYEESIHNKIRGNDRAYMAALNCIDICQKNDLPITVGITPMKDNFCDIGENIEFIVGLGVKVINISNFVPTGRGTISLDLQPDEWKNVYLQIREKMKKYNGTVRFQIHDVKVPLLMPELEVQTLGEYKGCLAGYTHCYILPNGDVNPCVMLPIMLGNLKKESLKNIIERYQRERDILNKEKLKGHCKDCRFKYLCGGCRANAYAYYHDPNAQDPHCWIKGENL